MFNLWDQNGLHGAATLLEFTPLNTGRHILTRLTRYQMIHVKREFKPHRCSHHYLEHNTLPSLLGSRNGHLSVILQSNQTILVSINTEGFIGDLYSRKISVII